MSKRNFIFQGPGDIPDVEELAAEFDNKQTQAIALVHAEIYDWARMALSMLQPSTPACLKEHVDWLDQTLATLEELDLDAWLDEDMDDNDVSDDVDSEYYFILEELLTDIPVSTADTSSPHLSKHDIQLATLERLSFFWIDNIVLRLQKLQAMLIGDGEPLRELNTSKLLQKMKI